jgi:N-acetylglucosaminyl-diphospho-decaprenol L-rhamnosyltransferase
VKPDPQCPPAAEKRLASPLAPGRRPARPVSAEPIDVTVCIVNWNCRAMLHDCLASLCRKPQGVRLEVVVVDNGSTDGAPEMTARDFPEVILVRNARNLGFARANNQAAAKARGRYLFFLNNDTMVPPNTMRQLLDYARDHPHVGMIGPRLRNGEGQFQKSYRPVPTLAALLHRTLLLRYTGLFRHAYHRYRRTEFDPNRYGEVETLMGAALFLSRDVFFHCGPWDEDFTFGGEDLYLSVCVARRHPLVFLPQVEVIHYGGVSTRQHMGYAITARAAGYVHYLRKSGTSRAALLGYKLAITLDAPLQLAVRVFEYLVRRLRDQRADAHRSRLSCRALCHFLTRGLMSFWSA